MIQIDDQNVERVTYLIDRIVTKSVSRQEEDEFMRLMFDSNTIQSDIYLMYQEGQDRWFPIHVSCIRLIVPMLKYVLDNDLDAIGFKPAA